MRSEFDLNINGAWDKLDRYHREAVTDAALRQCQDAREPSLERRLSVWTRRVRQVLHLRPGPVQPS